ncbi:hypothetical protein [Streptomyces sp. NPDC058623]|uniref:hypothetical protein n=1 Tax=Streptomyces sp. NPDC058623 TaxID=3346563 RepID=UPI00365562DF
MAGRAVPSVWRANGCGTQDRTRAAKGAADLSAALSAARKHGPYVLVGAGPGRSAVKAFSQVPSIAYLRNRS